MKMNEHASFEFVLQGVVYKKAKYISNCQRKLLVENVFKINYLRIN